MLCSGLPSIGEIECTDYMESRDDSSSLVSLSWSPSLSDALAAPVTNYSLTISPSPTAFSQPFTTNNTTVTLTLNKMATYSIFLAYTSCVGDNAIAIMITGGRKSEILECSVAIFVLFL